MSSRSKHSNHSYAMRKSTIILRYRTGIRFQLIHVATKSDSNENSDLLFFTFVSSSNGCKSDQDRQKVLSKAQWKSIFRTNNDEKLNHLIQSNWTYSTISIVMPVNIKEKARIIIGIALTNEVNANQTKSIFKNPTLAGGN